MILIHGKITNIHLDQENSEIVFEFKDNSEHRYNCYNNKVFFIVNENDEEKKYITLCEGIDNYRFSYDNTKLTTMINIGEIVYNNIYNIKLDNTNLP